VEGSENVELSIAWMFTGYEIMAGSRSYRQPKTPDILLEKKKDFI
jgi:hypothetical protein